MRVNFSGAFCFFIFADTTMDALLSFLFESSSDFFCVLDKNGFIRHTNAAFRKMLGYSEEELNGMHEDFYKIAHPDEIISGKEVMLKYFRREIPEYRNIFRVRHKDGHWVWILSRGIGIWDEKGNIQRLIGTHTDITEQKQREEERKIGKLPWEPFSSQDEWELARWLINHVNQKGTDTYLKLPIVSY